MKKIYSKFILQNTPWKKELMLKITSYFKLNEFIGVRFDDFMKFSAKYFIVYIND